jgi:hypothetical protein
MAEKEKKNTSENYEIKIQGHLDILEYVLIFECEKE